MTWGGGVNHSLVLLSVPQLASPCLSFPTCQPRSLHLLQRLGAGLCRTVGSRHGELRGNTQQVLAVTIVLTVARQFEKPGDSAGGLACSG